MISTGLWVSLYFHKGHKAKGSPFSYFKVSRFLVLLEDIVKCKLHSKMCILFLYMCIFCLLDSMTFRLFKIGISILTWEIAGEILCLPLLLFLCPCLAVQVVSYLNIKCNF